MAVIVVDPGHGGTQAIGGSSPNNASGPTGTLEKDITLKLALELAAALEGSRHEVELTRRTDVNLSLQARANLAKQLRAAAFVSIHCNGWNTPDVQGSETWIHSSHGRASNSLATKLQAHLVKATGLKDRGVKSGNLGVLNPAYHDANTAACLVEVSFLTDPAEEMRLNDPVYRRRIVDHLAIGLDEYLKDSALQSAMSQRMPQHEQDGLEDASGFVKEPGVLVTEPELWKVQAPVAEAALRFTIDFLGCRMGNGNNVLLDEVAIGRLRQIVRAVSIVESRHGTQGANEPARDPFQCGNPGDAWWKELTKQSGQGSRFIRGPGLSNLWANELAEAAEGFGEFNNQASMKLLADIKKGHKNNKFSPYHSYTWGIIYLIHRINTTAGDPSYACKNLSRQRLVDGAVEYNGGGVPNYKQRIEEALREIGDIGPPLRLGVEELLIAESMSAVDATGDAVRLVSGVAQAAAGDRGGLLRSVRLRFGGDGLLTSARMDFWEP